MDSGRKYSEQSSGIVEKSRKRFGRAGKARKTRKIQKRAITAQRANQIGKAFTEESFSSIEKTAPACKTGESLLKNRMKLTTEPTQQDKQTHGKVQVKQERNLQKRKSS
jgi:hypothetical protein